jgi:uncharacterized membrane protein YphA (DoxX/SURF4 family)
MQFDSLILHVKWFTDPDLQPIPFHEVLTTSFLFWFGVTLAGLLLSAIFNEPLQRISFIQQIHHFLDRGKPHVTYVLRIGLGIALILQLIESSYLAPEMAIEHTWVTVALVVALLGLISLRTLIISGLALAALYVQAISEYGWFHALDYIFYVGVIYYLLVSNLRWKETATPALYLFTGLSLAWVGIEKMLIPELSYRVVAEHAIPTFGFSVEDFVLIAAFIEVGLAWTFIVGILNRFVSIVVTMVFITTTFVFGYTEIVGHTIFHTVLIMFLIQGEGTFKTPFQFHNSPILRYSFVLVNFSVLLFGLMWIYIAIGS